MPSEFASLILGRERPKSIHADVALPRRIQHHPSPADWRDEILYFLLVDRFSDGRENGRPLLDRKNRPAARPQGQDGQNWRWDRWAESGAFRGQSGTLKGIESKLDYLKGLGVSTIWLSPVFKQRGHLDTFHGYGIQHFLDVDPHFGTRKDLVDLVAAAHGKDIRIILDIIFNHFGFNWVYPNGGITPGFRSFPKPIRVRIVAWTGGGAGRHDGGTCGGGRLADRIAESRQLYPSRLRRSRRRQRMVHQPAWSIRLAPACR